MSDKNLDFYIEAINKFRPKYIQAYPSAITILSKYMNDNNIEPFKSVELVLVSSENLYSFQKQIIYKSLRVPICNLYGHVEACSIAGNCTQSENLHFYPGYGLVEILDENGEECTEDEQEGEIVATSFINSVFPLIRYKTSDRVIFSSKKCTCGWNYKIVKQINGREQEFIITNDKRKISIAALNMHSNIYDNILKFQFHQRRYSEVIFNYLPKKKISKPELNRIYSEIKNKLGDDFNLILKEVKNISPSKNGKYNFLIQDLS